MEEQEEEQVLQEEVMETETEDTQVEVVERADVGQPPLEEVEESPALEQAQPQPLGWAPPEDEIMSSPRTGVCKEKT